MNDVPATADERLGCAARGLLLLAGMWVVGASAAIHAGMWIVEQSLILLGFTVPPFVWLLVQWLQGVVVALPLLLLTSVTRSPAMRAVLRPWIMACLLLFLFAFLRLVPSGSTQLASLAQTAVALVGLAALHWRSRASEPRTANFEAALAVGMPVGGVVLLPWIVVGALGSPLDALLNLLSALVFGALVGQFVYRFVVTQLPYSGGRSPSGLAGAGLCAGVALAVLGSGFGFDGSQLLLTIALPPLGFALVAISRLASQAGRRWLSLSVAVSMAVAGPVCFVDPDELTLVLGLTSDREVLANALRAAALSAVLAIIVAVVVARLAIVSSSDSRRRTRIAFAGVPVLVVTAMYFAAGQPGFYGERLFVILAEQADLSRVAEQASTESRAAAVYRLLVEHADRTQAPLRTDLDRLRIAYRPYYLVNAIEVDADPPFRAYLATRPEVGRVLESPRLRPLPAPLAGALGSEPPPSDPVWNVASIGAPRVWEEFGVRGQGVVVGTSDSGVDADHPALRDGYRGRSSGGDFNWFDPWSNAPAPRDLTGHGTHTLGTVLGRGGIGVAPEAEWIACVNLERNVGNPALYLDCLQFNFAPYPLTGDALRDGNPALGAQILNNSWGCTPQEGCDPETLRPAAEALKAAGIFVVASAGNEGNFCNSVNDPIAAYDSVLAVGAVGRDGDVSFFSSRGPATLDAGKAVKPDLVAPGEDILSAFPGGTYARNDGTSMAGPHVTGVVALMWSAQPILVGDVDRTAQILRETAEPYNGRREGCFSPGGAPNAAYGYGIVDAYAAVKRSIEVR